MAVLCPKSVAGFHIIRRHIKVTTSRTYEVIRKEMVRSLATQHGFLVMASLFGLLVADSGLLPKAKEKIQSYLNDPDYFDRVKGNYSDVVLTNEELLMILEDLSPKIMWAIYDGIEEEYEKGESILSPVERGISRLLLNTDFSR
jgi:hypothetical protein